MVGGRINQWETLLIYAKKLSEKAKDWLLLPRIAEANATAAFVLGAACVSRCTRRLPEGGGSTRPKAAANR
jgi:hypothetical protein